MSEETNQPAPKDTEAEPAAPQGAAEEPASEAPAEVPAAVATSDEPEAEPVTADPTEAAAAEAHATEVEPASADQTAVADGAGEAPAPAEASSGEVAAVTADAPAEEAGPAPETAAEAPAAEAPATEPAAAEQAAAPAEAAAPQAAVHEPTTMAELLDMPDVEVKSLKHGDVVEGTVVRIDPDEILVDFGGKSEGVVSNRELISRRGRDGDESRPEIKIGDEVLVYVLQPESPEGHAVLSLRRAGLERKWRAMQERFDAGEIVEARVIDHNKGGLIVDLGVRGFVPISQIVDFPRRPRDEQPRDAAQEIAEKLQPFVGRTLRLKILEVNRKANRLILSEKVALYEERREKRDELFSSLQVGQRVKGTVRSIAPFGVFVDLGGIDGLVHKSELSWNKVNNPETAHSIGDEVEAEVIDINHERGRISLSIRRLMPDPWQESVAKYAIGDVIEGVVTKLVNFGAFVRVEEGLEGLIHISELSNQRVAHPGDVVKEGETLRLKIISLDSERHRLGLSLKQADDRTPVQPSAAPARREDRPPRRDRRDRRDRDFRPEDAIREPDEGIDNTMAAAFAESGLLAQFRASQAEREAEDAKAEDAKAEEAKAEEPKAAEPKAEEAKAEEPKAAEPKAEDAKAEEPKADEKPAAKTKAAKADEAQVETRADVAEEPPAEAPASEAEETKAEETKAEEPPADGAEASEAEAEEAPAEEAKA